MEEKSRILKKVDSDKSRPVSFKESFGGSESQFRLLLKHLPDESFKNINLILNNTNHDLIEKDKINVLWMHHFVNQKEARNLASKDFVNKLDWIVYNSNWNQEQHIKYFKIPKNKSVVIRNAIEKINYLDINSFNVVNNFVMSPSLLSITEANSSFCVLAKLRPSIIKSLINGLSGFFV